MKILNDHIDLDGFFDYLSGSPQRVLLLDFDGTLSPFKVERDEVRPYPGVIKVIEDIQETRNCRTVIISGRDADDLIPLLGFTKTPEIWGCHGWQRVLPGGKYLAPELDDSVLSLLKEAFEWSVRNGLSGKTERKAASVAIHWRGVGDSEKDELRRKVNAGLEPFIRESALFLHEFDGGMELLPAGRDKGSAVRTIMDESGDGASIAYLGDDLTDENAFNELGGKGLCVLVNSELRPTSADLWIRPPGELLEFLKRWLDRCLTRR